MPLPGEVQDRRRRAQVNYDAFWKVVDPNLVVHQGSGVYYYKASFVPVGGDDELGTPAQIRTLNPMNPNELFSMNKFEVRVQSTGLQNAITVGLCDSNYPEKEYLPGWKARSGTSIGVDCAEGKLYHNTDNGEPVFQVCGVNDTIKCILLPVHGSENMARVEFHRNDQLIVQKTLRIPAGGFYGVIGLASTGEKLVIGPPERVEVELFENHFVCKTKFVSHEGGGVCVYVPPHTPTTMTTMSTLASLVPLNIGVIKSRNPIDPHSQANLIQVRIDDSGEELAIAVGICTESYPDDSMPGWQEGSVGYHADISSILNPGEGEEDRIASWGVREVMQCVLEPVDGSTKQLRVIFRKGSDIIGKTQVWNTHSNFYWCIGMMSKGEQVTIVLPPKVLPLELPRLKFEDVWQLPSPSLEYIDDGVCAYSGQGGVEHIGIIRSRQPINPLSSYPFFEVKILNAGVKCQVAVGVCSTKYPLNAMPGWTEKSIGFHCDSGNVYQSSQYPETTDHPCAQGDVIRCTLEPVDQSHKQVKVIFHRNHKEVKRVIDWTPTDGFYAQIGLMSRGESVQVACPLMMPSTLQPGVENIRPDLLQPPQKPHWTFAHSPRRGTPMQDLQRQSSERPGYKYNPPASPAMRKETSPSKQLSRKDYVEAESLVQYPPLVPPPQRQPNPLLPNLDEKQLPQKPTPNVPPQPPDPTPPPSPPPSPPTCIERGIEAPMIDDSMYRVLYQVSYSQSNQELDCLPSTDSQYGYIQSRRLLSEKMSYFELSLVDMGGSEIAVGLAPAEFFVNRLLGESSGTLSLLCVVGKLLNESRETQMLTTACTNGDIIGCQANLRYKAEIGAVFGEKKNLAGVSHKELIQVDFFRNGLPIGNSEFELPPNGVYPTICISTGTLGSKVKVDFHYGLDPQDYFKSHPLPIGFTNFKMPSDLAFSHGWKILHNCSVYLEKVGASVRVMDDAFLADEPGILQHCLPFTCSDYYCEVELVGSASAYSVLCLGALPRIKDRNGSRPGETQGSLEFLPLAGLVMRSGSIGASVPETVHDLVGNAQAGLRVGIGVEYTQNSSEFFCTINSQEVARLINPSPDAILYPTFTILPHPAHKASVQGKAAVLNFPKLWPYSYLKLLPWGFARSSGGLKAGSDFIQTKQTKAVSVASDLRVIQGSYPLSPARPYYEVMVIYADTDQISVGLSYILYPLNTHPGWESPSTAYHIHTGSVVHNSLSTPIFPVHASSGVRVGCGVVFSQDGNRSSVEVFYTLNGMLVYTHHMEVPTCGLFPTVGIRSVTGTSLYVHMKSSSPLPRSLFTMQWHKLKNIFANGNVLHLITHVRMGLAQLDNPAPPNVISYFEVTLSSTRSGKIFIGFSNTSDSPLSPKFPRNMRSYYVEITEGIVIVTNGRDRKSDECEVANGREYGCGIQPVPNSEQHMMFFTVNRQMVYSILLNMEDVCFYPSLILIGSDCKVKLNSCALWPPVAPIGCGWGRYQYLELKNGHLTAKAAKTNLGFAQAAEPLTPSNTYFEVDILKRDPMKAIAVGLSSRRYSMSQWVGWKQEAIAYHADDGNLFKSSGLGISFGPKLSEGDSVGCGIRFAGEDHTTACKGNRRIEVFFTVNGTTVGGSQQMTIPQGGLFPTVCIESPSEQACVHLHSSFPSSIQKLSTNWIRAFSVVQAGSAIENSCRLKKPPMAFCQIKEPFSQQRPYFEMEIMQHGESSALSLGVASLSSVSSTELTDMVAFNFQGLITVHVTGKKTSLTRTRHSCVAGNIIGCQVRYICDRASAVDFYRNHMKVMHVPLPESLTLQPLYPTVTLTHAADSVIPMCSPQAFIACQHQPIGWLRSERVKLEGFVVEHNGPAVPTPFSVGVAQISQPLSKDKPYFELEVLCLGDKATISIGAAALDHPLSRQPGWESSSIGYHGDDGKLFHVSGHGVSFGPKWKIRDVIGMGVRQYKDSRDDVQVFFTWNGQEQGHVTAAVPANGFFPSIGTHSRGEKVKVCQLNVKQSFTTDTSRLKWRTLVGVQLYYSVQEQCDFLKFFHNSRMTLKALAGQSPGLGVAIAHKPFSEKLQYFEVEILKLGKLKAVAVGATHSTYSVESVPGWMADSVAYHSDSGDLHHASGRGTPFGPMCQVGDTMGCGVSFIQHNPKHCHVFFTHNGMKIGRSVQSMLPKNGFYPSVGLTSPGDKVAVRFYEAFKSKVESDSDLVGILRIHNCSYADKILHYSGSASPGTATAQFAVSLNSSRNYYTAQIIHAMDNIWVGLATRDYPVTHAPGMSSFSIAYNIHTGYMKAVFSHDLQNKQLSACKVGDTIGCGLMAVKLDDSTDKKTTSLQVYFTRNGKMLHQVQLTESHQDLYPTIGFLPVDKNSILYMDWNTTSFELENSL